MNGIKRSTGINITASRFQFVEIEKESDHDTFLRDLLEKNLKEEDRKVRWPSEVRTGLVYWKIKKKQD